MTDVVGHSSFYICFALSRLFDTKWSASVDIETNTDPFLIIFSSIVSIHVQCLTSKENQTLVHSTVMCVIHCFRLRCIQKIFMPLDFFHILLHYSLIKKKATTIPHNDKAKTVF